MTIKPSIYEFYNNAKNKMAENLTPLEAGLLQDIVNCYDEDDNICYNSPLTPEQKGVMGSLVKKGLVYDSFKDLRENANTVGGGYDSNFFPTDAGFDAIRRLLIQRRQLRSNA